MGVLGNLVPESSRPAEKPAPAEAELSDEELADLDKPLVLEGLKEDGE